MDSLNIAKSILESDYIKNYCVLEMLKASYSYDIDILNDSVFLRVKGDETCVMLSAKNREDGRTLLSRNLIDTDNFFYTIGHWPQITEGKKVKFVSDCVQLYLPDTVPVEADISDVIPLTEDMAQYIHEHYDHKDVISVDYIKDRIRIGPAFGIMADDILAGWVMTHEEGTMGVLTVLPEYRRRGYAHKLNAAIVKSLREQGKPCIVHIIKGNTPSLTLSQKTGMVYNCDVEWIVLE